MKLNSFSAVQQNAPLGKFTAARLGGNADWLYVARSSVDELVNVARAAWDEGLPVRVIGGGANILISDRGVRGLVIVNRITGVERLSQPGGLHVAAGTGLLRLAREAASHGLTGMEWAVGVPGTVGGAVVNNAGAHGGTMADSVLSVEMLTPEGRSTLDAADMDYDYRHSALKSRADRRFLVLSADLQLAPDDPAAIRARMEEYNAYRKRTQPPGASLGSIFKNPPGDYAGRLIESCGLKGTRIGGVQVSDVHANFFVNDGHASATEYFRLIRQVQRVVQQETGVTLELEIELVGDWSESD